MGESKVPLYAYVDESGNTGKNIFDLNQPDFFTAAFISRGDFDRIYSEKLKKIASLVNDDAIHAAELGFGGLEKIAPDIVRLLSGIRAYFFVSRVQKSYLLASKMFDVLFDSGENAAVAWHVYNMRPLRLILVFKLAYIIDDDIAKRFWDALLEPAETKAQEKLCVVCQNLLLNVPILPDEASRKKLSDALRWIIKHPECIHIHIEQKLARKGHFPNMVAFANLLDGLEQYSKSVKRPVAQIIHDDQSEFEAILKFWHEMFSSASDEPIHWLGETYVFQKVVGSQFSVVSDNDSSGIQIADIVLWLYNQFRQGKEIPPNCGAILEYVFLNGWESDFSYRGVQDQLLEKYGSILFGELEPEQEAKARLMIEQAENRRLEAMERYEMDGLPPFARSIALSDQSDKFKIE
ncbi:DUF3800 domain-containing protein [Hyphococcus sp.]|uniref:DUF3800 domain-containing protein n=1 Tax=Hyphococcus sp. TaxID=2038636 RepID=UPI0035C72A24